MKHLTIVVPEGDNNLSSITGTYEIFKKANEYWRGRGKKELFTIQLAGLSNEINYNEGLFTVKPHTTIAAIRKTSLIIIPSLNHNYQKSVKCNTELVNWIFHQYKNQKSAHISLDKSNYTISQP